MCFKILFSFKTFVCKIVRVKRIDLTKYARNLVSLPGFWDICQEVFGCRGHIEEDRQQG